MVISYLKGKIQEAGSDFIVVNVNCVGYKVYIPMESFDLTQDEVEIFTKQVFREDDQSLYGFPDRETKDVFEEMTTISGIGPKTAMLLVQESDFDDIRQAVKSNNKDFFTRVKGIGPKTAEKLIFELRRKLETGDPLEAPDHPKSQEVIGALEELGYNTGEAKQAIASIEDWDASLQELVKKALQE